jgi:hypothetical protein
LHRADGIKSFTFIDAVDKDAVKPKYFTRSNLVGRGGQKIIAQENTDTRTVTHPCKKSIYLMLSKLPAIRIISNDQFGTGYCQSQTCPDIHFMSSGNVKFKYF